MYNKCHAYQIFCNDRNGVLICAHGIYKYQEMRTVHHRVHFVSISWQEKNQEEEIISIDTKYTSLSGNEIQRPHSAKKNREEEVGENSLCIFDREYELATFVNGNLESDMKDTLEEFFD